MYYIRILRDATDPYLSPVEVFLTATHCEHDAWRVVQKELGSLSSADVLQVATNERSLFLKRIDVLRIATYVGASSAPDEPLPSFFAKMPFVMYVDQQIEDHIRRSLRSLLPKAAGFDLGFRKITAGAAISSTPSSSMVI